MEKKMDLSFFVVSEILSDDSIAYNVVAREDEDDEDEQPVMVWRAPTETAAKMLVAVLTEVGAEFENCNSDAEYSALATLYMLAAA